MSTISDNVHKDKAMWRSDEEVMSLFEEWIVKYGKLYNDDGEKDKRFQIFKSNLRLIDERNAENLPYKLGLTPFVDLTTEEFGAIYLRRIDPKNYPVKDELPDSVDWRKEGALVPIKDQARCVIL